MDLSVSPFHAAMKALKEARALIEQGEVEIERMHNANNVLMQNVQSMRAAYDTLATSFKEQGRAFESLAKQNGPRQQDPLPKFLTERRSVED